MDNSTLLVGLDIGTTSIKVVVADAGRQGLQVYGAVTSPTKGMRHGKIVDIDLVAESVKSAIQQASEKTNSRIFRVVTALPVSMLQLESATGLVNISDQGREVTDENVTQVMRAAIKAAKKKDRQAVAFFPSRFLIDGEKDVDDPRTMIARSLLVQGLVMTAPAAEVHNINTVLKHAGIQNNFFVPAPMAVSSVALDEAERTFGAILLDLGGGSTTATVIRDNQIKYATVDLKGAADITHDISVVLSTTMSDAEALKRDYGYAEPELASENEKFAVKAVGKDQNNLVSEKYLSEIINARLQQILRRVGRGLYNHDALSLPAGVIITGGSALLAGIDELVAADYDVKAKIYQPAQIGLRNPVYSVAYGIVNYVNELSDIGYLANTVIYDNGAFASNEKPAGAANSQKIAKRVARNTENDTELAYNKTKHDGAVDTQTRHEKKTDNNENKNKGLAAFFRKFFD
ncbi:cell division protein FtsA [Lactobacillus nasalidis]|uniref:Cell division protein FtsA n=1 Tax=Lactobacillus nasalidis TaxID=2797258 RepID=A0ABQ3W495_9LACO|nr:cell division protein FtsA [Lactobacillus nasalidis]GHV97118.1 cell division protein FtsA [Lactobacillus nasalidis]GHV99616.1 cell division protein FtsA [Lactobacillus nasalidis]GHW01325.1 cell division protein FtsA [Lactobacillus nasalidis]